MTPEQAAAVVNVSSIMWEAEHKTTCQVLAAIKDDTRDYKPDPKSRTAWQLATHLATADVWFIDSIVNGAFIYDPEAAKQAEAQFKTVNDVVEFYRKTLPDKLRAVREVPAEKLTEKMDFFGILQMPRANFVLFANNHSIHHRGQLAAYLRALGSKVPDIYGPSADSQAVAT